MSSFKNTSEDREAGQRWDPGLIFTATTAVIAAVAAFVNFF